VTDIFREVEEDVRRERFEQLWKKYSDYIISGAALIVIAVAGLQLWRVYDERQHFKASNDYLAAEQLLEAGQASEAATAFARLEKDAPGGYAALSKLEEADAMLTAGNTADALTIYKQIAAGKDEMLGAVARIHAGWAIADSASKSDVEAMVAPLTDPANPWHDLAREILAYADYRAGNNAAALKEYQAISNDTNATEQLRVRAKWMATFLQAGGAKNYGTVPPPPKPETPSPAQQNAASPAQPQAAPQGTPPK
jgi:hypothetical protein